MSYIDNNKAIEEIEKHIRTVTEPYQLTTEERYMNYAFDVATDIIANIPPADVFQVRRGKWIKTEFSKFNWYKCSECKIDYQCDKDEQFDFNYCPNCGAKMEKLDTTRCSDCEHCYWTSGMGEIYYCKLRGLYVRGNELACGESQKK